MTNGDPQRKRVGIEMPPRVVTPIIALDALEQPTVIANAFLQFTAALRIERNHPPEEIALRHGQQLELALIDGDGAMQHLIRERAVVCSDRARQRGALALRRGAITDD